MLGGKPPSLGCAGRVGSPGQGPPRPAGVLDREHHLGVGAGGPLPPFLGRRQVAEVIAGIGRGLLPEATAWISERSAGAA